MSRYNLCVLVILWLISPFSHSAGNGSANILTSNSPKNNNFNLRTLYAKNRYSAMEYGKYNPTEAIQACPNIEIWPEAPDLPNPEPDCTVSGVTGRVNTQVAYGCEVKPTDQSGSIGGMLSHSVVGIAVPGRTESGVVRWNTDCTGTIVGSGRWILTAAHCIANKGDGKFISELYNKPLYIVPWQQLHDHSYGVPPTFTTQNNHAVVKFEVEAAYIPYNFANSKNPPYIGYIHQDFALLKLKYPMPDSYKSIDIASVPFQNDEPLAVWRAGYGDNENQKQDGQLHYRKEYYVTNKVDGQDLGEIYTVGSIPELYHGVLSAWSFSGGGDSGGPILLYDPGNKIFYIEGILSAGPCHYAGYFAQLPYPYAASVSTADGRNHELIKSIINGTSKDAQCISITGGCNLGDLYVIDQNKNKISSYSGAENGDLHYISSVDTGSFPTQIAASNFSAGHKYVYVTNYNNNTISRYVISEINGNLVPLPAIQLHGSGPTDIKIEFSYAYIVEKNSNSISIYSIMNDGGLTYVKSMPTTHQPTSMIIKNGYGFVIGANSISIYRVSGDSTVHLNDYELPKLDGVPLEIVSRTTDYAALFGEAAYMDELYLLTNTGIYIYKIYKIQDAMPHLILKGSLRESFNIYNHISPLDAKSFAVSTSITPNIRIYKVDDAYNISLEKVLGTPPSAGMETIRNFDDKTTFFYTANPVSGGVSVFNGGSGFNNLTHASDVGAGGNKPSIIKYVE